MSETISTADDIIERIRYRPNGINSIEARIAAAILEDPERLVHESITSFAGRTAVSAGSVVRFAKLVGLGGFKELKLAIAGSAAQGKAAARSRSKGTRFSAYMDEQIRAVLFAAGEIQPIDLETAASALAHARSIDIAATGASVTVAQSLLFSLTMMGLHVRFLPDTAEQAAAAGFLQPGDCLLVVSYSGRTRTMVDAASRANKAGATVIALTCNSRSPLLRHAKVTLLMDANKGRFKMEWPLRTGIVAVARALSLYVSDLLPEDDLRKRRSTWSSGRFGMRYDDGNQR